MDANRTETLAIDETKVSPSRQDLIAAIAVMVEAWNYSQTDQGYSPRDYYAVHQDQITEAKAKGCYLHTRHDGTLVICTTTEAAQRLLGSS